MRYQFILGIGKKIAAKLNFVILPYWVYLTRFYPDTDIFEKFFYEKLIRIPTCYHLCPALR